MEKMLKFLLVLWLTVPLSAQTQPTASTTPAPGLEVQHASKKEPLTLTGLSVDVTINGFIAETKMTMTFFNPHDRILEGDFNFPLPEGSFVNGYALDINGVMVDGVVVEKQKGRVVFEKIVRQGVDPGLVEWVEGNNFRTRIFPIPAKGSRTVSVRYLSELIFKNTKPYFYLPLHFKEKIKDFSIRVEVMQTNQKPKIEQGEPENFQFTRWHSGFIAKTSLQDYLPQEKLIIALPVTSMQNAYVEKSSEDDYYFCIQTGTKKGEKAVSVKRRRPRHITILWDASASMGKYNHRRELQLLRAYFSGLKKKKITVDLVLFHHKREKIRHFIIDKKKNNIDMLIQSIKKINYDGGTSLAAISPPNTEPVPDFYLLFSDGSSNFGKDEPIGLKAPVYVFCDSPLANHAFLYYIARQTGGNYFNLNKIHRETILMGIGKTPYSFISVTVNSGSVSEIYPQSAQPVYHRFSIAGKLLSPQAEITLNYGINGRIMRRISFMVSRERAVKGNRLRTFWAQKKIAELQIFPGRNHRALVETGKKYGLVTRGTSLIVLDSLEQYLEHRVMPPESLPQMRDRYIRLMKEQEKEIEKTKEEKLEYLVKQWNKRIDWWKKSFPLPAKKPEKTKLSRRQPTAPTSVTPTTPTGAPTSPESTTARIVRINPAQYSSSTRELRERSCQYIAGKTLSEDGDGEFPGVLVTLTGESSGYRKTTLTNQRGDYIFADIPADDYNLKVELEGFITVVKQGIRLRRGDKLDLGFLMRPVTLREEVIVTARAPTVDTTSTAVANLLLTDKASLAPGESYAGPVVTVKEWDPETPYLEGLKEAGPGEAYTTYIKQKEKYANAPSFYLDCAEYLFKVGRKEQGLRVLSNIAEMELENPALLRVLGYRLRQLGDLELSALVFEKVLGLRPEEPQSYRDLALVLQRLQKFERAVELLYHVITHNWDQRFEEIELIALMELNNVLRETREAGSENLNKKIDRRLLKLLDVDIRIVLTWDADMTDMDLWVIDPKGEKSFYKNTLSYIGGLMSNDFTEGYGPEEYVLKKAVKGEYIIKVNYYSSSASKLQGPVTLQVDIFTDYGRKSQKRKSITLRLKQEKEVIEAGSIRY
ncbi:MAG: VIT domain-containing protein [Candidatus Aminicenantes bacterium]|jgi:tetratricopeptide (TPR) repeat protein